MENADFVDFLFAPPQGTSVENSPALPSQPIEVEEKKEVSHPVPAQASRSNLLPGFHLTAQQLAEGLRYAWEHAYDTNQGARDLLAVIDNAFQKRFGKNENLDIEGMTNALQNGSWVPSLSDLVAAGLHLRPEAIRFMPAGSLQLQLANLPSISFPSTTLPVAVDAATALLPHERRSIFEAISLIQSNIPGATIEHWSTEQQ